MYNSDLDLNNVSKSTNINLDSLIEGLSSDIDNVNSIISGLKDQKKTNNAKEEAIIEERKKLEKDKQDFENYVTLTMNELSEKKKTEEVAIEAAKLELSKAQTNFKDNMDRTLSEMELAKSELEAKQTKLREDKEQFEMFREREINRINKDKDELDSDREEFEKYKEEHEKRIKEENKNLEQQFNKFKAVIDQFNVNFKDDKE